MNNGMRPGIFHNPDPTYEKRQLNCILNQNGYVMISKRFLKKSDAAESILIRSINTASSARWICSL